MNLIADDIEKSLHKVLIRTEGSPITETDITTVLAEHLLGKLAPGGSYLIDAKTRNKDKCKCGCGVYPAFGSTGIGMRCEHFLKLIINSQYIIVSHFQKFQFMVKKVV